MERLCADGTISTTKSGKYICYLLNPKAKKILQDYLPGYQAADETGQAKKGSSELQSAVLITSGKIPSSD